jgi:hypothetical protein
VAADRHTTSPPLPPWAAEAGTLYLMRDESVRASREQSTEQLVRDDTFQR